MRRRATILGATERPLPGAPAGRLAEYDRPTAVAERRVAAGRLSDRQRALGRALHRRGRARPDRRLSVAAGGRAAARNTARPARNAAPSARFSATARLRAG